MKCFFLLIVFGLIPLVLKSQFTDNFSDGNLNGWQGETGDYIINVSEQLQLSAPSGSTDSWIYTDLNFEDSMTWEIYFKLDFAPSTSNLLRIYLGLTSSDLATASGYFLEIGASGDMDALDLKYLSSGVSQVIASSIPGLVASEPVDLKLRINKHENGTWEIFDISGIIPELLFTANHNLLPLSSLNIFGLYTKYTDTRRDKFFFDDILIQPIVADNTPPSFQSLTVVDNNTITLIFDELLNQAVALNPSHYILMPGNLQPNDVIVTGNQITLSWAQSFVNHQTYNLQITGLEDAPGNEILVTNAGFTFTQVDDAGEFEILITEIMADPTPIVGLPDAEYIELYNNSTKILNLGDYTIRIGSSERSLPDSLFLPGEYFIISDESVASEFAGFGKVIPVDNFPSLTNSGTMISIQDQGDIIIHSVTYSLEWYNDAQKSQGGWSLEMKNPTHICAQQENWSAAVNLIGGTPGGQNSSWNTIADNEGPELISVFTGNSGFIELRFDENLDEVLMTDPANYTFNPSLNINGIMLTTTSTVRIELSMPLQTGIIYSLLPFDAFDCIMNLKTSTDTIEFGLVTLAVPGDILINEILFNPATGGSRFIEIINVSDKFIDLSTIAIGRITDMQTNIFPTGVNEIINPGTIVVLTPDRADILSRYNVPFPARLFEASLPTWDEDSDHAAILSGGEIIDSFTYSSDWHHPVISDQNGVSLERISTTAPTSVSFNWHSASSVSGHATPTGVNSQYQNVNIIDPPYLITNKHFTPDGDGYKDFLLLQFEPESGNDVGSIWVYDLEGREIHQVLSNELIGSSALITWDGRNAEGLPADMGIYLLFIQMWDPQGNVTQYQESCALVKR